MLLFSQSVPTSAPRFNAAFESSKRPPTILSLLPAHEKRSLSWLLTSATLESILNPPKACGPAAFRFPSALSGSARPLHYR